MAKIPPMTIAERIDAVTIDSYPRPHLGASQIGHACQRSLVYSFRWAFKKRIPGKLNRIFNMGHHIEDIIIEAVQSIGIKHYGSQDRVIDSTGHAGGSVDGIVSNVPGFEPEEELLFEAKSMNHTNFLDVKRNGVQKSKPVYYGQVNMYMGRMELDFAMFVALDKNTSDLYFEIVPFDKEHYEELLDRENNILYAQHINEFTRISDNPSWFMCKFCDAKDICHSGGVVESNCRTCEYGEIHLEGKWFCGKSKDELSVEEQLVGCMEYQKADMFKEQE